MAKPVILRNDEATIAAYAEAWRDYGVDLAWLRDILAGAAHPDTGQAYLDRHLPDFLDGLPGEQKSLARKEAMFLYLHLGFLDRYHELIDEMGIGQFGQHIEFTWMGTMLRDSGFTAHPGYLRIAHSVKFPELWDTRGPPDMCEKPKSEWICQ
jgi:hypothetical protein